MPKRKNKRTDTEQSDSFEEVHPKEKVVHFGTVHFNRMLAPDQIEGDDTSKYSILAWSNTLQAQRLLPWPERRELFKRALRFLPNSYKIWHAYLQEFVDYCGSRSLLSKEWLQLNKQFEAALQKLPRMPRIWIMYASALEKQHQIKRTREVYNWSFKNLPLTQHQKIWKNFTTWCLKLDNSNTALHIIPRYLKLNPDFKETFAEFLVQRQLLNEGIKVYQNILNDDGYHSKAGKDKKDFYFEVIDLITQHPEKVNVIDCYQFIRKALDLYPQQSGKIWVKLSDYFIRLGDFDRARDMLQQAIEAVDNAKDFGIIFNAYVKFEEQMITALANNEIRSHYEVKDEDNVDWEIERRLQKLQNLLDRQPYLLLKIAIRKNPNQIQPWLSLIALHKNKGNVEEAEKVIQDAIEKINSDQAEGKFSDIWVEYLLILQEKKQFRRCNQIMDQATQINFRMVEDFLTIWRRWAEFLMEEHYYEDALKVVQHVLFKKKIAVDSKSKNTEDSLKNHATLWQLYIDLQINLGNFDSTKRAFQRCKEHRSLTPLMLLNYTKFLWQNTYFEQTFRVFEFALSNFKWPSLHEIWIAYTSKFVQRHGGTAAGVERSRSMFERLLKEVPQHHAFIFYFIYAQFEENYGLYSHTIQIFDRMVKSVLPSEKFTAYSIYITKVAKLLGITKTRPVFEHALQSLKENQVIEMGRKYAELQTHMGEFDRTRAIYGYISQFCDPRDDLDGLWKQWQTFEVQKGDRDTYKEYLRIKRSVQAKYTMLPPDLQKIQQKVKMGLI